MRTVPVIEAEIQAIKEANSHWTNDAGVIALITELMKEKNYLNSTRNSLVDFTFLFLSLTNIPSLVAPVLSTPILSTQTCNPVPGVKVGGNYVFPSFGQTLFKGAWIKVNSKWRPGIIKFGGAREIDNLTSNPGIRNDRDSARGVSMPRYEGVQSEFTGQLIADTDVILKHIRDVSIALKTLHSAGFVHCDVKPSNVFLDGECNAFLGDFGSLAVRGEEVYSYTPGYTVEEVEWLSARPVHDWLALLLSVLQLLRKLPFTELPHKWSVIEKRIGALRGDTDPCHIELVRIFDEEVIPCI